jgi:hypothetical protein
MVKLFGIKKKLKMLLKLETFRFNEIGEEGAAKLGEGVSKLVNLTALNLNFG